MAWTAKVSPGLTWTTTDAWWAEGTTRWLIVAGNNLGATDDFETYTTSIRPTNPNNGNAGILALGACYDGTRWHVVGDAGYFRSTDGLIGAAWEVSNALNVGSGVHGGRAITYANGRLVVVSSNGKVCLSTDGGETWTTKATMFSPGTFLGAYCVAVRGNVWMVSANSNASIHVSTDNGETWAGYNPLSGNRTYRAGAIPDGSWKVSAASVVTPVRITTDNGATWLADGYASRNVLFLTTPTALYEVDESFPATVWFYTSATREPIDMTGHNSANSLIRAGDRLVALNPGTSNRAPYVAPGVDVPGPIELAWPVSVFEAAVVSLSWPVSVAAPAGSVIGLAWPVSVSAPATVSLGWPVQVLDAAVLGGLNGAGAWAAAPDGRWQAVVVMDGVDISSRITGRVSVQIAADAARTAEFAFVPAAPLQPMGLIGRPVRIAFAQAGGLNAQTIFSGVIDVPTVDVDSREITCACHDQAQEVWSRVPRTEIDAMVGGEWHVALDGEPADNFDYLQQRLQSVGASWALDALQQPQIVPWRGLPRSVTVRDADFITGTLAIDLPSRDQLLTRIVCRLQYRYERLRSRGMVAQYAQPTSFFIYSTVFELHMRQMLLRSMVFAALDKLPGWERRGEIATSSFLPGAYQSVSLPTAPAIIISPTIAPEFLLSARAEYTTRWRQTITEDYTVTVVASGLESMVGTPVADEVGCSISAEFAAREWGSDPSVEPSIDPPSAGDAVIDWQPEGFAAADRDECLRTLMSRAWVRLWSASRSGRVRFALPCRPDLWIDTWAQVESARLRAAGQIVDVEHVLDMATGEAITSCAVAVGLPGDQGASMPAWTLPPAPVDTYDPPLGAYSCEIGTFVGGQLASPPFDEETMIGFSTNGFEGLTDQEAEGRNFYPHQFSVRAPGLAAEDRDPRTLESVTTISVDVPTDLLELL